MEIHKIMKSMPKARDRNLVAMGHAQTASGAGAHKDKTGPNAPRNRQKREWKKEIHND